MGLAAVSGPSNKFAMLEGERDIGLLPPVDGEGRRCSLSAMYEFPYDGVRRFFFLICMTLVSGKAIEGIVVQVIWGNSLCCAG